MCVCIYVCMYVCVCVCVYVCIKVCMCVHMHVCVHGCMYARIYVCVCIGMCVCVYVCMHICMYVHSSQHSYILAHTQLIFVFPKSHGEHLVWCCRFAAFSQPCILYVLCMLHAWIYVCMLMHAHTYSTTKFMFKRIQSTLQQLFKPNFAPLHPGTGITHTHTHTHTHTNTHQQAQKYTTRVSPLS